jgi:hypothetical protein
MLEGFDMREGRVRLTDAFKKPLYPPPNASIFLHDWPFRNFLASGPETSNTDLWGNLALRAPDLDGPSIDVVLVDCEAESNWTTYCPVSVKISRPSPRKLRLMDATNPASQFLSKE